MLNEQTMQQVFTLLSAALFQTEIELPDSVDWGSIFEEMKEQTVAGIPADLIGENPAVDAEVKEKWTRLVMGQVGFVMSLLQGQQELVELMESRGIPMAILKGAAVAVYYPQPEYRTMGDVDFLVDEMRFDEASELMRTNGFRVVVDGNVDYHTTWEKNGVIFEIHKYPAGMPKGAGREYVLDVMKEGLRHTEMAGWEQWEFPVLPDVQNGMVLLLHMIKHLEGGFGLRQILDWMMFVDRRVNDRFWREEFQPVLQKAGLETMAKAFTRMCQRHLGLSEEKITWCLDADEELADELICHFFLQGNFGRRTKGRDKGVKFFSRQKNLITFLVELQKNGRRNWKMLEQHPGLWPFAWIYQICRYMKILLTGKYTLRTLASDAAKSREKREMFRKLFDE